MEKLIKVISILLIIVVYSIYLYNRVKNRNKCTDTPELVIKPSDEQKRINISLGIVCAVCIILLILFSIDFDINMDAYTKIKILSLKQTKPVLTVVIGFLLWYFMNSVQATIFYQHSIQFRGDFIKWSSIYRVKRVNDTKLKICYKDNVNAYINLLHSSQQKDIIDNIVMLKVSEEVKNVEIDL